MRHTRTVTTAERKKLISCDEKGGFQTKSKDTTVKEAVGFLNQLREGYVAQTRSVHDGLASRISMDPADETTSTVDSTEGWGSWPQSAERDAARWTPFSDPPRPVRDPSETQRSTHPRPSFVLPGEQLADHAAKNDVPNRGDIVSPQPGTTATTTLPAKTFVRPCKERLQVQVHSANASSLHSGLHTPPPDLPVTVASYGLGHVTAEPKASLYDSLANGPLPIPKPVTDKLADRIDWLRYWGDVQTLHLATKRLLFDVDRTHQVVAYHQEEAKFVQERLESVLHSTDRLREVFEHEQQQQQEAFERERRRHDELQHHNDALTHRMAEVRRSMMNAELAVTKMKEEVRAAKAEASQLRDAMDQIEMRHSIDMLELKKELTAGAGGTERLMDLAKRQRLQQLESEIHRHEEAAVVNAKTIEVLTEETSSLRARLETLTAAASEGHPRQKAVTLVVDTAAVQQMTQRQYQKREAELVAANASLRQQALHLEFSVDTLKHRFQSASRAAELELMASLDRDAAAQGLSPVLQLPSPSVVKVGPKGSATVVSKNRLGSTAKPIVEVYQCTPFQFPPLPIIPSSTHPSPLFETVRAPVGDALTVVPEAYQQFQAVVQQLWSVVERNVAEHPQKAPTGEKETLHAWVKKSTESFAGGLTQQLRHMQTAMTQISDLAEHCELQLRSEMERKESECDERWRVEVSELREKLAAVEESLAKAATAATPPTGTKPTPTEVVLTLPTTVLTQTVEAANHSLQTVSVLSTPDKHSTAITLIQADPPTAECVLPQLVKGLQAVCDIALRLEAARTAAETRASALQEQISTLHRSSEEAAAVAAAGPAEGTFVLLGEHQKTLREFERRWEEKYNALQHEAEQASQLMQREVESLHGERLHLAAELTEVRSHMHEGATRNAETQGALAKAEAELERLHAELRQRGEVPTPHERVSIPSAQSHHEMDQIVRERDRLREELRRLMEAAAQTTTSFLPRPGSPVNSHAAEVPHARPRTVDWTSKVALPSEGSAGLSLLSMQRQRIAHGRAVIAPPLVPGQLPLTAPVGGMPCRHRSSGHSSGCTAEFCSEGCTVSITQRHDELDHDVGLTGHLPSPLFPSVVLSRPSSAELMRETVRQGMLHAAMRASSVNSDHHPRDGRVTPTSADSFLTWKGLGPRE